MNEFDFNSMLNELELYYGEYDDVNDDLSIRDYVLRWLQKNKDESRARFLFDLILESCPRSFGAPDIARINDAIKKAAIEGKCSDLHKSKESVYKEPEIPEEEQPTEEDLELLRNALSGKSNLQEEYNNGDAI